MIDYASPTLAASLAHTEADALETLSAAKDLLRPLRKLRTAAEGGDLAEIDRSIGVAQTALAMLQRHLKETQKSWIFDVHGYLARGGYAKEVLVTAKRSGVNMSEREDRLFCYPALIRIAPGEKSVYINRKRERRIWPSVFVNMLKEQQDRPITYRPDAFLAALHLAYSKIVAEKWDSNEASAPIIPLVDIHSLLTLLPEQAKEYSRQEFVRDIYMLHRAGVDTTKQGARVSFPISRGVRGKTLTVIDETGEQRRYYGICFFPPVS